MGPDMGTPNRTSILDNIETTLTGITTANGYKTDVTTVERVLKTWDEVGSEQYPWLGFLAGIATPEYQPGNLMRMILPFTLFGHINEPSSTKSDALSDLEDDLIAALNADQTRGDYAVSTTIKTIMSDDGDPDSDEGSKGGSGTIVMEIEIVYMRTTASS